MAEKGSLQGVSKKTLELRNLFLQQINNPYRHMTGEGGHVFDPAFYRHQAMRATQLEFFKPTFNSFKYGLFLFWVPFSVMFYLVRNERNTKENAFRTGQVSYRDRNDKFT